MSSLPLTPLISTRNSKRTVPSGSAVIFWQLIDHSTCFGNSIAEAGWTEHDLAAVVTKRAWDGGRDGAVITGLTDPSHITLSRIVAAPREDSRSTTLRLRAEVAQTKAAAAAPDSRARMEARSWQRGSAGATSDRYEPWWAVIRRRSTGVGFGAGNRSLNVGGPPTRSVQVHALLWCRWFTGRPSWAATVMPLVDE